METNDKAVEWAAGVTLSDGLRQIDTFIHESKAWNHWDLDMMLVGQRLRALMVKYSDPEPKTGWWVPTSRFLEPEPVTYPYWLGAERPDWGLSETTWAALEAAAKKLAGAKKV